MAPGGPHESSSRGLPSPASLASLPPQVHTGHPGPAVQPFSLARCPIPRHYSLTHSSGAMWTSRK